MPPLHMCHFVKNYSTLVRSRAVGVKCLPLEAEVLGSIPGVWPIENCAGSEFQWSKKRTPRTRIALFSGPDVLLAEPSLLLPDGQLLDQLHHLLLRRERVPAPPQRNFPDLKQTEPVLKVLLIVTRMSARLLPFDSRLAFKWKVEHERFVNIGRQECTGVDDVTMYWVVMEIIVIPGHLSVCFGQLHIWED